MLGECDADHGFRALDYRARERPQPQDAQNPDNLSHFLLACLGLGGRVVAKNANGEKDTLSLRHLARYFMVDETAIIDERSPILSGQYVSDTVERNIFRVHLTGRDDAAVVSTMKSALRKARVSGQIELIDEMIACVDEELRENHPSRAADPHRPAAHRRGLRGSADTG